MDKLSPKKDFAIKKLLLGFQGFIFQPEENWFSQAGRTI